MVPAQPDQAANDIQQQGLADANVPSIRKFQCLSDVKNGRGLGRRSSRDPVEARLLFSRVSRSLGNVQRN
jgi:hypothetical protein